MTKTLCRPLAPKADSAFLSTMTTRVRVVEAPRLSPQGHRLLRSSLQLPHSWHCGASDFRTQLLRTQQEVMVVPSLLQLQGTLIPCTTAAASSTISKRWSLLHTFNFV